MKRLRPQRQSHGCLLQLISVHYVTQSNARDDVKDTPSEIPTLTEHLRVYFHIDIKLSGVRVLREALCVINVEKADKPAEKWPSRRHRVT